MPEPGPVPPPPAQWREHWFEHRQVLRLDAYDDHVAVYHDADVDAGATRWVRPFLSDVWQYSKHTYGDGFGPDRLYVVLHQGRYGGGHAVGHTDPSHDHRNVIDCGPGPWHPHRGVVDIPVHEVCHIVEGDNNDVNGSPAYPIWGDSKWAEFFAFDVMTALGHPEADDVRRRWLHTSDDFPRPGTHWFRDWFHPMWSDAAGPATMVRFFRLLAEHFPRRDGTHYARDLTWGEYLHFTSAAAGVDLRERAVTAFGVRSRWRGQRVLPRTWEEEWERARAQFARLTY